MTIYFLSWFVKNKLNRGCSFWEFFSLVFPKVIDPNAPTKMAGIIIRSIYKQKRHSRSILLFARNIKNFASLREGFVGREKK